MNFCHVDPTQDPRWAELVERHPKASVFHTVGWLKALQRTYGYKPVVFTTSSPTGDLRNGLVCCRIRSWLTGNRMVSLPFSDYCEPLFDSVHELDFLLKCLKAELERQSWKYLEVRPLSASIDRTGEEGGFQTAKLYYLHRLDLRRELDDIFRNLHKDSVQRRIRRAGRAGLVCECGRSDKLLRDFYSLQLLTRSRHHLPPQPYAWFRNLVDCMGNALEIRLAYKEEVPIAAILTLRFRNIVYYKYGCSDARYDNLAATALLFWKTIQDSKMVGAEEFDLGRSDIDDKGLIAFKDHWTPGHTRIAYWRCPASDSLSRNEERQLKIAKRMFAFIPRRLLAVTGELIYRHIG